MMTAKEIRNSFLKYFESKEHQIVKSAPIIVKNDPTLMFTNAGMNQFKDIFLGNTPAKFKRVADTQKCLRVSGKHNDLEEVGIDTYHHTMFEMLGNWSFGDYFKAEAVEWAWEYLTTILKIDKSILYATYFEGSKEDNLDADTEVYEIWKKYLPDGRIIKGSKKDNFWEMGNTGPCGPCSEIHIDLRSDEERKKIDGRKLVNTGHPEVIEIWNLVFIQYNRNANGELNILPNRHVDTGMGFERLCRVIQGKKSNYDTDIFQPIIKQQISLTGFDYRKDEKTDIAMRVVADHLRAVSFAIADGQLPSNNKAGYVIRRILRRAVRYAFTFLKQKEPYIYKLVPVLIESMGEAFPELKLQHDLIVKVIYEEEAAFLRTLEMGMKLVDIITEKANRTNSKIISGKDAFELYDTYGFPVDLTQLILNERGLSININEFEEEMNVQKERSRNARKIEADDWIIIDDVDNVTKFIGYDTLQAGINIVKYRKINEKGKEYYHLVFNQTPFYAESGGQVGDKGFLSKDDEKIEIINTIKENNLIIHIANKLPLHIEEEYNAYVSESLRIDTARNHSATHLLHSALRKILGTHVEQKGSLVSPEYLRFDFSHFQKVTDDEIKLIENEVNEKIRNNISIQEYRNVKINDALNMGAMALFGEKYGDMVRVIKFDDSVELCGGTHVMATGQIGYFKIISESAISAGVRRIEAISGRAAEKYIQEQMETLTQIKILLNNPKNLITQLTKLIEENNNLIKQISYYEKQKQQAIKESLKNNIEKYGEYNIIAGKVELDSVDLIKDLAFQLRNEIQNMILILGAEINKKAQITCMLSENVIKERNLNAIEIIKEIASEIQGGGGGQVFYATAGGKNIEGIENAINKARQIVIKDL